MKFFSRILLNFILFMAFSGLFPAQFFLGSWTVALVASVILTILEIFIKPILSLLFLPINFLVHWKQFLFLIIRGSFCDFLVNVTL